jgi:hypothetical protein
MSKNKLRSVFEYPMAPDISSNTRVYTTYPNTIDISCNIKGIDASSIILNPVVFNEKFNRLDNSKNQIGQGMKCKPKMYDSIKVELAAGAANSEFSLGVIPTRIPYFGDQNTGRNHLVANVRPQRVVYIVSAERERERKRTDSSGGQLTQMEIVSSPYDLTDGNKIQINCDIDTDLDNPLKSNDFGDVTVSYSYAWDVHGEKSGANKYPEKSDEAMSYADYPRKPLTQKQGGGRYLVISCVPTFESRDARGNFHKLSDETYGITANASETEELSFGYVSYNSVRKGDDKNALDDNINYASKGFPFPRSSSSTYSSPSVFDDNWFKEWKTSFGDLAEAMQGKTNGGSGSLKKVLYQSSVVNTNFLKKLLYIKKSSYHSAEKDNVNVYITVLEDWVHPDNALNSYAVNSNTPYAAAYIPYLDVNASRQIVSPDYDIWDSDDKRHQIDASGGTANWQDYYYQGTIGSGTDSIARNNHYTLVPHQRLNKITDFPDFNQHSIGGDQVDEPNKDMILFDWRAKSLAQPTFACCNGTFGKIRRSSFGCKCF